MSGQPPSPPRNNQRPRHWDGDATLHSYCYDYMLKRGWHKAASAFAGDTGINEQAWRGPPIEAPQGLLYEWWTVFWDIFLAHQKDGNRNPAATIYADHQRAPREMTTVNFTGNNPQPSILLPRPMGRGPRLVPQTGMPDQQAMQDARQHPAYVTRAGPPSAQNANGQSSFVMNGQYSAPTPGASMSAQQFTPKMSPVSLPGMPQAPSPQQQPNQMVGIRPGQGVQASPQGYSAATPIIPPTESLLTSPAFIQGIRAMGFVNRSPESLTMEEKTAVIRFMRKPQANSLSLPPQPSQQQQIQPHQVSQDQYKQHQQLQWQQQQQLQQQQQQQLNVEQTHKIVRQAVQQVPISLQRMPSQNQELQRQYLMPGPNGSSVLPEGQLQQQLMSHQQQRQEQQRQEQQQLQGQYAQQIPSPAYSSQMGPPQTPSSAQQQLPPQHMSPNAHPSQLPPQRSASASSASGRRNAPAPINIQAAQKRPTGTDGSPRSAKRLRNGEDANGVADGSSPHAGRPTPPGSGTYDSHTERPPSVLARPGSALANEYVPSPTRMTHGQGDPGNQPPRSSPRNGPPHQRQPAYEPYAVPPSSSMSNHASPNGHAPFASVQGQSGSHQVQERQAGATASLPVPSSQPTQQYTLSSAAANPTSGLSGAAAAAMASASSGNIAAAGSAGVSDGLFDFPPDMLTNDFAFDAFIDHSVFPDEGVQLT